MSINEKERTGADTIDRQAEAAYYDKRKERLLRRRKKQRDRRVKMFAVAAFFGVSILLFKTAAAWDFPEESDPPEVTAVVAAPKETKKTAAKATKETKKEEDPRESAAWKKIFDNPSLYPEDLLKDLERNTELLDFVAAYPTTEAKATGGFTETEKKADTPLFLQWDSRWGYAPYGSSNIAVSGCGPTCLSMVLFSLTRNESLTPNMLADRAMQEGYYVSGVGTSWSFMANLAPQYGVTVNQMEVVDQENMKRVLRDGSMIICAMGPGDFTDAGHFIVLKGVEGEKLLINDPFSKANTEKKWEYDTIVSQSRQMWIYTKNQ